jgi:hypothetical protein
MRACIAGLVVTVRQEAIAKHNATGARNVRNIVSPHCMVEKGLRVVSRWIRAIGFKDPLVENALDFEIPFAPA